VDHATGKNLIGAFHQPRLVLQDIDTFRTLPVREVRAGLAECIKHGVIRDAGLFEFIGKDLGKILANDSEAMSELVARNSPVEDLLRDVRPDELTPREALELVYRLKALMAE